MIERGKHQIQNKVEGKTPISVSERPFLGLKDLIYLIEGGSSTWGHATTREVDDFGHLRPFVGFTRIARRYALFPVGGPSLDRVYESFKFKGYSSGQRLQVSTFPFVSFCMSCFPDPICAF